MHVQAAYKLSMCLENIGFVLSWCRQSCWWF